MLSRGLMSIRSVTTTTTTAKASAPQLTWTDFLQLRKQQGRINTATSIVTATLSAGVAFLYIGTTGFDPEKHVFGYDAMTVYSLGIIGAGFLGFLAGPTLGNGVFKMVNRRVLNDFKIRDQAFLERIKHNRVDPSRQSFSNPVPDFYGERIYSVKDYKQWLRDCHAFRRKAKEFL